jgi:hypothetical protein
MFDHDFDLATKEGRRSFRQAYREYVRDSGVHPSVRKHVRRGGREWFQESLKAGRLAEREHDPFIVLHSGNRFYYKHPEDCPILIEDIAHALSHIPRFTGHTHTLLSVAEHCIRVSKMVPAEHALAGLLHDAPEYVVFDMNSPLKSLCPDYRKIEARVHSRVMQAFGLPEKLPAEVKEADLKALAYERRAYMHLDENWNRFSLVPPVPMPLVPTVAKEQFLKRFYELTRQ